MRKDDCIFCRIAAGQIPATKVYEDDMFVAIMDLGAATKGHTLILPKEHYDNVMELDGNAAAKVLPLAAKIGHAMMEGLGCSGFNLVQNNGTSAGQTVHHFHLHIIPRYDNGPDMVTWTPGEPTFEELESTCEAIRAHL